MKKKNPHLGQIVICLSLIHQAPRISDRLAENLPKTLCVFQTLSSVSCMLFPECLITLMLFSFLSPLTFSLSLWVVLLHWVLVPRKGALKVFVGFSCHAHLTQLKHRSKHRQWCDIELQLCHVESQIIDCPKPPIENSHVLKKLSRSA